MMDALAPDRECTRQYAAFTAYDDAIGACRRGDVAATAEALGRAFSLDPDLRLAALEDDDLESFWSAL